jgi:UDP-galactopyranose mutase
MKYDYLIVGAGLFGAVFANLAHSGGKRCLVIDRRAHIGGNVYSHETEGIQVHKYGPHIFHTSDKRVWAYVNRFAEFNRFVYCPIANYKGELYNLPFNMNTFSKMWRIATPDEAKAIIDKQTAPYKVKEPTNLEEQALALVGEDLYEKLIKGYTEKQWGRVCSELPSFIIRRLPLRFTFDNNYFNDLYQGIPSGGYTEMIEHMLAGIETETNVDYLTDREYFNGLAGKIIYTGQIDAYFEYALGNLEYRSLAFETETLDANNRQGVAAVNYTDADTPFTRSIEHKHFAFGAGNPGRTILTREYPKPWARGGEAYYPINDARNGELYAKYKQLAERETRVIFGGRLGTYRYLNMDEVIASALDCAGESLLRRQRNATHETY